MSRQEPNWADKGDEAAITQLLVRMSDGDPSARDEVFTLLYSDLKRRALRVMQRQPPDHSLQATALIGAAYERIVRLVGKDWQNRGHFLAVATKAMRSVLVDAARRPKLQRSSTALERVVVEVEDRVIDILAFDEALNRLAEIDPEMAKVAEMRGMGLGVADTAAAVGIAERTLRRRWPATRAFLYRQIHGS